MNYNKKSLPDLYTERIDGVKELKMHHFSVNSLGQVIVTHRDFIGKNGLIMFYQPWCSHCNSKDTRKLWSDLSMLLGNAFPIGAVNCSDHKHHNDQLAKYAKILGYPTIKLVHKDGTLEMYEGKRTHNAILNFICERAKHCI